MLFRRIVLYALLAGVVAGLVVTGVQYWKVIPIIHTAETFEAGAGSEPATGHGHEGASAAADEHGGHDHGTGAWAPDDGIERMAFTLLSNVLAAIGFALVLLAVMVAAVKLGKVKRLDWRYGLLWGAAGYAAFFVAPALGMPPNIPGTAAASLEARQVWWVLAVVCTGAGLAGVAFGKSPWRWAALALLVVPYAIGGPARPDELFPGRPQAAVAQLEELSRQFIVATAIANAAMWLVIGAAAGWAAPRIVSTSDRTIGERTNEFAR